MASPPRVPTCSRRWRTVHPDAVATIEVDGRRRWMYLEVDQGTAELRRDGLKLRRYAHFYLSGSWRREYATFPELRIVHGCGGCW